jgi:hypothetical protein
VRAARVSLLIVVATSACTLLTSRDGLVGPPIDAADASSDGEVDASGDVADDSSDASAENDAPADAPVDAAAPQTIYANQIAPLGITVDGTNLYWVAGQPKGILKAPRLGGGAITHYDDVNQPVGDVFDVAVDSQFVYWTQRGGAVLRRGINGGTNESCFSATGSAAYIALAGGVAFVTDFLENGSGSVVRGQCGGAAILYSNQSRASGIAATTQLVYWGRNQNDQIAFGPAASGGSAATFHAVVGAVGGVAVDADAIYWLRESRRVMRFTFAARVESELYDAGGPFGDGDIAVDDDAIYWTEQANGVIKRLKKPPL